MANNMTFGINIKTSADMSGINQVRQELDAMRRSLANADLGVDVGDIKDAITSASQLERALVSAFDVDINTINIQKFQQELLKSGTNLTQIRKNLSAVGPEGEKAFLSATASVLKMGTAVKETNKFLNSIATSFLNTVKWQAMSSIVNNVTGSVSKAYNYVKDLDQSLNDIRIVSGQSADDMARFATEANKAAQAIGVSTKSYAQGALIYYQQGLDTESAKALADITAKTSNVTGQSMGVVSEQLTAVYNGYQVANQAAEEGMQAYERYVDKMAAVGATTASNLAELSTAMSKVASTANTMGVGFDELTAQIATMVSVTRQAPESVGTALRTIYMRMSQISAGETAEDGVELGTYTKKMNEMGVSVLDANNKLRDMDDIMTEVGNKWSSMTREQQVALAQVMSGTRQANYLLALFDNWGDYQKTLNTSLEATGTLEQQQAIYLESIGGKLSQMKAASEGLYGNLFDQDAQEFFKTMIEGATGTLNVLSSFADALGGLTTILPTLGALGMQVFGNQISGALATTITNIQRSNAEVEIQKQNIQTIQEQLKNGNFNGGSPALQESTSALVKGFQDTIKYYDLMSQADKERYNQMIDNTKEIGHQSLSLQEQLGALKNINETYHLTNTELEIGKADYDKILQSAVELNIVADELNVSTARTITELNTAIDHNSLLSPETKNILKEITSSFDDAHIADAIHTINVRLKELGSNAENVAKLGNRINVAKQEVEQFKQTLDKLDLSMRINQIVNMASSLGQLAIGLNQIRNLGSIITNDSLSTTEKFFQVITNLSFTITTLHSALTKLRVIEIASLALSKKIVATEAGKSALLKLQAALSANRYRQEAKEVAIREIFNKLGVEEITVDGELITLEQALASEQAQNLILQGKECGVTSVRIGLHAALTKVLGEEAAAMAMALGPAVALVAVLGAGALAYKKYLENLKESAEHSYDSYSQNKEDLERVGDQLQTNIDRLKELSRIKNPTYAEQKEIDKLQKANKELERQKALLKENAAQAKQNALDDVTNAVNKGAYNFKIITPEAIGEDVKDYFGANYIDKDAFEKRYAELIDSDEYKDNSKEIERQAEIWKKKNLETRQKNEDNYNEAIEKLAFLLENNSTDESAINKLKNVITTYYKTSGTLSNMGQSSLAGVFDNKDDIKAIQEKLNNGEDLKSAIGNEKIYKELTDSANTYGLTLEALIDIIKNTNWDELTHFDDIVHEQEEFISKSENLASSIREINKAITENHGDISKLSEEQLSTLDALAQKYPILAEAQEKSAHQYLETLRAIGEVEEKNAIDSVIKERDALAERAAELRRDLPDLDSLSTMSELDNDAYQLKLSADIQEVEDTVQQFLDKDHELKILLQADFDSDIENAFGLADEFDQLTQSVISDLTVTAEEAQALIAKGYGAMLDNAKPAADGLIQLDKEVMNNFIDNKQAELEADRQSKLIQLDNQYAVLQAQETALQSEVTALQAVSEAKTETEAQEALQKAQLAEQSYEQNVEILNKQLEAQDDYSKEVAQSSADLTDLQSENAKSASEALQAAESAGTDSQAREFRVRIANIDELFNAYAALGNAVLESATGPVSGGPPSGSFSGGTGIVSPTINPAKRDINKSNQIQAKASDIDISKFSTPEFKKQTDAALKSAQDSLSQVQANMGANRAAYAALQSAPAALDKAQRDAKAGGKGSGGGGGGGKNSEKDLKYYEEEFDLLHDINEEIERSEKELSRLGKIESNVRGTQLIDILTAENELLDTQIENYEELQNQQIEVAEFYQGKLKGLDTGMQFSAQGEILNYKEATENALKAYNDAVEGFNAGTVTEEVFKQEEEKFKNFKEWLEEYEDLINNKIPDTDEKIVDAERKKIQNDIKAWDTDISIELDFREAERQWNDFCNIMEKDFQSVYRDLSGDLDTLLANIETYEEGTLETRMDGLEELMDKMDDAEGTEAFSMWQEELQKQYDGLIKDAKDYQKLIEEVYKTYLEYIDQVADRLDDLMDKYDRINKQLEFQKDLIELIYGKDAYDLLKQYYDAQYQNNLGMVDSYRQQYQMWKNMYEAADEGSQDQAKYYDEMTKSQDKLNKSVTETIKLLQTKYVNAIKTVIKEMEIAVAGMNTDDLDDAWDLYNKQAKIYYDNIEAAYETQQLANKIQDDIDNASSLKDRQKLQAIYDKEIGYLKDKKDLTEYDLQAAEARYNIALKQMALEDAQANKNSMKLVRNTAGNWTYQYVADQDELADKQQDLLDAYNDLYELSKNAYKEALETAEDYYKEFNDKLQAIYEDTAISDEERTKRVQDLYENYYGPQGLITLVSKEGEVAKQGFMNATDELGEQLKLNTEDRLNNINLLVGTVAAQLMDKFNGDDSVRVSILTCITECEEETTVYSKQLDELAKTAEMDFGEGGISKSIGEATEATKALSEETTKLVDEVVPLLDKYKSAVNDLAGQYADLKDKLLEAARAAREYADAQSYIETARASHSISGGGVDYTPSDFSSGGGGGSGSGSGGGGYVPGYTMPQKSNTTTEEKKYKLVVERFSDIDLKRVANPEYAPQTTLSDTSKWKTVDTGKKYQVDKNLFKVIYKILDSKGNIRGYTLKKGLEWTPVKLDTGGYTGSWDSTGKLAMLHQKELVLNADDTKNMLEAVETVRDISSLGSRISQTIQSAIAGMVAKMAGIGKGSTYVGGTTNTTDSSTTYNITAEFPNANNVNEIREAILSLPNLASQRVNRK